MPDRTAVRAATRACADLLLERLDEVARRTAKRLEVVFPELAEDPDMAREFEASVRANLATGVPVLAGDAPAASVLLPEEVVGYARMLVHRQVGLDRLLEVYRVGHAHVWRLWMDLLVEHVEDRAVLGAALQTSADDLERYVERLVGVLVEEFERERERWARRAVARRSEVVQRILRDARVDVDRASAELAHELRAIQTALVLWTEHPQSAPLIPIRLERATSEVVGALGLARALTVPVGASSVWVWLATDRPVDPDAFATATATFATTAVRIAVGASLPGVEGFRASHRQALRAQHVARRLADPGHLTRYEDVGALAVVADDDDAIRDFVQRELGALAAPDHGLLRETVAAYLRAGGSAPRAAAALHTHRNTVLQRLRRAEPLLGHPLDERRLELELALRLRALVG